MTSTPTGPAPEPVARTTGNALEELRRAEAARVLGLLDPATLQPLASQWALDGLESENVQALAAVGTQASPGVLLALLAEAASDEGIHFANTAEARALHASSVIAAMATSANPTMVAMTFSNNYTDELSTRVSRLISRVLRRK